MSVLGRFLSRQLGRPSGPFGRLLVRVLNRMNAPMTAAALDALALADGDRLLDVGFGGGDLLARALAAHGGLSAAGLDRASDAVALVRARFASDVAAGRLALHTGDAGALPFPDGAFTAAVTVNTVYFWPDLPRPFAEAARVLAPGGRLAVVYNDASWLAKTHGTTGFHLYAPADVERALAAAGLSDVSTRSRGGARPFHVTLGRRP